LGLGLDFIADGRGFLIEQQMQLQNRSESRSPDRHVIVHTIDAPNVVPKQPHHANGSTTNAIRQVNIIDHRSDAPA